MMADSAYWWLFGGNAAICWISHYTLAGRITEQEAKESLWDAERRGLRREISNLDDRIDREVRQRVASEDARELCYERVARDVDELRTRVYAHTMTAEERQQRIQAWMVEAEALHIDLSRIMRDLK